MMPLEQVDAPIDTRWADSIAARHSVTPVGVVLSEMFSLRGRRALVTGSSEGIGRAIAIALGDAGAEVVLHGVEVDGGEAARAVAATGARVSYLQADFAAASGVDRLIEQVGSIDILVSNVAMQVPQAVGTIDADAADHQFQLITKSFLALVQGFLPGMRRSGWGRIVAIGSVQESKPHRDMIVYAGLKAAQENIVRNLAGQVAAGGITVNNVAPGVVRTARNRDALEDVDYAARVLERIPMGRFASPEEIAGAVLLLCSPAGSYITGATIPVDGGMSL